MTEQYLIAIPVNPEPWKAPTVGRGRAFANKGSDAYKQAVRDYLAAADPPMLTPPYRVHFLFWRKRFQYKDKGGRTRTRNAADATNMQKLTEDAIQGILISNDVADRYVTSQTIEQGLDVDPRVVIMIAHLPDPERIRIPEGFTAQQLAEAMAGEDTTFTPVADANDWSAEKGII